MRLLILTMLLPMTACGTIAFKAPLPAAPVVTAAPKVKLFAYSDAFQQQVLIESLKSAPPCARDVPVRPCSAHDRLRLDYLYDRNQMRVLGIEETP